MKPLVSVVILNWNGRDNLVRCLRSLEHTSYKPLEIVVVDNNSSDDSVSLVRKNYPKVRIVENKKNRGYSGGNNDGIERAHGKYIFILNNDTQVQQDFLGPLVSVMEADPAVGCVQPKIVYGQDHNLLNAVGSYFTSTGFLYHYGYRKIASDRRYNSRMTIYSAKGAAMMLRASALSKIGTFDEDFFIYFEETDLCHRLWLSGYTVIYEPSSLVFHYEAVDTHKQMPNATIMYLSYRNRIASFIKNLSAGNLVRILPVVLLTYIFLCLLYIVRGEWSVAWSVVRALGWNISMLPQMKKKRHHIQHTLRRAADSDIFHFIWRDPPPIYYYYLFTSLKGYKNEPSIVETNRY